MVPPTIVAAVDPNAPCKKRATITVWIFFALIKGEFAARTYYKFSSTYNAIIGNMRKNPIPETIYKGSRPNSSLKDEVTRGTTPNPSVNTLIPMVACNCVQ